MNDPATDKLKRAILADFPRFKDTDQFQFSCGKHVSCFNQCCSDVNIALTPYDVIRMKNRLGISSGEFIDKYTLIPFHSKQQFPVVFLRMRDNEKKTCHFVTPDGCSIYSDRPWACRMYPIGVASPSETSHDEKFYFLLEEEQCLGHESGPTWTIRSWMDDQGVPEYDLMGEEFKEITLHPFFLNGGQLDPSKMDMLMMVLYDIDKFRRFVFESTFLKRFRIKGAKKARKDDIELLRLGFQWLKFCLFGEKTVELIEQKKPSWGR